MSSKLIWQISLLARQIWFRATLFCIAAIATALMAIPHRRFSIDFSAA
ncbi:hypothetical protein GGE35_005347 [Rhizobium cellulosilyticum]|uniref:Uncharacterized protein n=1 Tax=Aliirhizobium cellulosilyticum TaxID=393664 RepID=A0A7W6TK31_9HYPH|nr:hypothetical protein [Rhizobium cellulosilyticum]MBB4414817.1 hypothetical protein [Rhizobium cellulosilyticum]MBB4449491.1 hypothetical protein [Rhizobium cellulosilyticum]